MPEWLRKFTKRLCGLAPGRYCIILTVGKEHNWQVSKMQKLDAEE